MVFIQIIIIMRTIQDIIDIKNRSAEEIIADLKEKSIIVPAWTGRKGLVNEYDPNMHPVMNRSIYPDVANDDGSFEHVTRITYDFQRLAVRRMSELVTGIPPKRIYKPEDDAQQEVARILESVYRCNRINSVNVERCNMLFAGCEVMTLWYAVEQPNSLYGFDSPLKLRCRNFSPMLGHNLYPLFDEYGDLIALSVGYKSKNSGNNVTYFDTYTENRHLKWSNKGSGWELDEDDDITTIGKIPAVYAYRPTPIWEDTSKIVFEMEWTMSRNGNYLRKNSKPVFCVFADEEIGYGAEQSENKEFRSILQYPKGSSAGYITWAQAVENLKFYTSELRQSFFTQLQLPDWSYESMKASPMSGESRKQLFIDAQLKVKDESGRLLEFFDREVNVVKAILKPVLPENLRDAADALAVETEITPFTITDEKDTITNLVNANGGKPIISQRESIEALGWSEDVDKTMQEIQQERMADIMEPTM